MKLKAIILALFMAAVFTTSCKFYMPEEVPAFDTAEEVMEYVHANIEYEAELDEEDYWQSPQETLELGTGDCEDFCILMMAILKKSGIDSILLILKHNFIDNAYHGAVMIGIGHDPIEDIYDPTEGEILVNRPCTPVGYVPYWYTMSQLGDKKHCVLKLKDNKEKMIKL